MTHATASFSNHIPANARWTEAQARQVLAAVAASGLGVARFAERPRIPTSGGNDLCVLGIVRDGDIGGGRRRADVAQFYRTRSAKDVIAGQPHRVCARANVSGRSSA